jgi:hypothetical protein
LLPRDVSARRYRTAARIPLPLVPPPGPGHGGNSLTIVASTGLGRPESAIPAFGCPASSAGGVKAPFSGGFSNSTYAVARFLPPPSLPLPGGGANSPPRRDRLKTPENGGAYKQDTVFSRV